MIDKINERIKDLRNSLHLSQEYVADQLQMSRSAYTQMENGKRAIKACDIIRLCDFYGVSADYLLDRTRDSSIRTAFMIGFETLDEDDQEEIVNLIRFKQNLKRKR